MSRSAAATRPVPLRFENPLFSPRLSLRPAPGPLTACFVQSNFA